MDRPTLTPKLARLYELPFGKHKGRALEDIVRDDPLYLDWLVDQPWLFADARYILKTFLAIDWVSRLVQEAVDERD